MWPMLIVGYTFCVGWKSMWPTLNLIMRMNVGSQKFIVAHNNRNIDCSRWFSPFIGSGSILLSKSFHLDMYYIVSN